MLKAHNVQVVDHQQIAELATRAGAVPRKRVHLLLHEGPASRPAAYHRAPTEHLCAAASPFATMGDAGLTAGPRQFVDLRRRCAFAGSDRTESTLVHGQIPIGVWHGFVVLEPNTAVLEIKPGPYLPNEFADWAPEEGDVTATKFVKWITNAAPGERWSLAQ